MGQEDILNFLEKADKPLSQREIAELLNEGLSKVGKILGTLFEREEIKAIDLESTMAKKYYGSNRRMRLYYHPSKDKIKIKFEFG